MAQVALRITSQFVRFVCLFFHLVFQLFLGEQSLVLGTFFQSPLPCTLSKRTEQHPDNFRRDRLFFLFEPSVYMAADLIKRIQKILFVVTVAYCGLCRSFTFKTVCLLLRTTQTCHLPCLLIFLLQIKVCLLQPSDFGFKIGFHIVFLSLNLIETALGELKAVVKFRDLFFKHVLADRSVFKLYFLLFQLLFRFLDFSIGGLNVRVYAVEGQTHFVVLGAQLSSCFYSLHFSVDNLELLLRHIVQVEIELDDLVAELLDSGL